MDAGDGGEGRLEGHLDRDDGDLDGRSVGVGAAKAVYDVRRLVAGYEARCLEVPSLVVGGVGLRWGFA